MAVSTLVIHSVDTTQTGAWVPGALQKARVLATLAATETYAQANDCIIPAVATAIQNSRRNGKTVTLVDAIFIQPTKLTASPYTMYTGSATAVSTADVTFQLNDGDYTTEYANATACPAVSGPYGIEVTFTEA